MIDPITLAEVQKGFIEVAFHTAIASLKKSKEFEVKRAKCIDRGNVLEINVRVFVHVAPKTEQPVHGE